MSEEEVHIRLEKPKTLTIENKVFKSAHDWSLTEKDLEKAARELGETEEKKKECLRKLKNKLLSEENVRYRLDDFYLLRFLRVRKYNVDKAYQNMKLFYEIRKKHYDLMVIPPLLELQPIQQMNFVTLLPYMDEEGRVIFLVNLSKWNPDEYPFEEVAPSAVNVLDIASMNPNCQINGILGIYDFNEMTLKHVKELMGWIWSLLTIVQNGYPWRIKKWYVLNTNRIVRLFYSLMKPLMSKKLRDRCVLLGSDINELHQHVNPALLPKRLNGMLEEAECDMSQYVLNNLDYLRYERSFLDKTTP